MSALVPPLGRVVGALACQKDSYLRSLETVVISCLQVASQTGDTPRAKISSKSAPAGTRSPTGTEPAASTSELWLIECADSVLFPEGGGQPTDHGTLSPLTAPEVPPISIMRVQRDGLRCVHYSPRPLTPGTRVRQNVDFNRRWDHMQQHTGQHLLSAVMDTYDNLATLSWGMGAAGEMSYVELPRKPLPDEIDAIQNRCNEIIRNNLPINVHELDEAEAQKLPGDYDRENGVIRIVKIGDLDNNTCCGTHLAQTSHISVLLLHHTQPIRSTNCRLFFTAGDRAIRLATTSIVSLRTIAQTLSIGSSPAEVAANVDKLNNASIQLKKQEKKLLMEIAKYEADRVKTALQSGKNALVYRPDGGMDFINMVLSEIKDALTKECGAVILASGQEKQVGQLVIIGEPKAVADFVQKVNQTFSGVKGGGKGRWQGKVGEWRKGDLEKLNRFIEP